MEIDIELLITLVEAKPVLWDKTCAEYKDKNETKKAWREVCAILKPDFEEITDGEKNSFGKEVIKRWGNVRDSFKKSCKKQKDVTKSGAGASKVKKYVFNDQLQFLNKVFKERPTTDSLTQETEDPQTMEGNTPEIDKKKEQLEKIKKPNKELGSRKRHAKMDPIELKMLKKMEEEPDRHLCFFKGIIPSLNTFTDDEVIQFQLGVMELITKIKKQRCSVQYHRINHPDTTHSQTIHQTFRPQLPVSFQNIPPQSQFSHQTFVPPSTLPYQTVPLNVPSPIQSTVPSPQLPPTSPTTSTAQFYRVYGEELSNTPSPYSINSSTMDSIDFADENML
ncbi:uncharacterized protein [Epargyreus clarus]|uniref:uncharacterized protein n=1 Tax=Epargyreus clarus TaxID=520877 RepID=UPI003C2DFFEF